MLPIVAWAAVIAMILWISRKEVDFHLSPAGIEFQTPIFRRTIPWESLVHGGPLRTPLNVWSGSKIYPVVKHPELITQKGFALGSGSKSRPILPLAVNVHPWFVADSIRWYAEHPEHRAGIGTEAEHERLIATLTPWASNARS